MPSRGRQCHVIVTPTMLGSVALMNNQLAMAVAMTGLVTRRRNIIMTQPRTTTVIAACDGARAFNLSADARAIDPDNQTSVPDPVTPESAIVLSLWPMRQRMGAS